MNFLLRYKWLLLSLIPVSTCALAHPGHMANDQAHGFLHIEHIIMLAAIGLLVYVIKTLNDK